MVLAILCVTTTVALHFYAREFSEIKAIIEQMIQIEKDLMRDLCQSSG